MATQTKPGTRRLSEVAKKLSIPSGIVATGWPAIREVCGSKFGIRFDDWQDGAGRLILAKRKDGKLASMIGGVGMSLPRQVGKTFLVAGVTFALCVSRPGTLVIWSAHHARTHEETFLSMQGFAKRSKVAPWVKQVFTGSGDEEVRFHNGSRILFGARERGFGRGIPGVDVMVFDEAQILSERALDNMLATLNTSKFGLALYMGTPPRPEDNSESFSQMRQDAWTGDLKDAVWIELGADDDASPNDRAQWAKANPSFPKRTPAESILRLQKKLKPESFMREGLGVWDAARGSGLFGPGAWDACRVAPPTDLTVDALGLASSYDERFFSIVGVHFASDGMTHILPITHGPRVRIDDDGADVVDYLKQAYEKYGHEIAVDPKRPAAAVVPLAEREGVKFRRLTFDQVKDACSDFASKVAERLIGHDDYKELNDSVDVAVKRPVGGRWVLSSASTEADISTLEAGILAAHSAMLPEPDVVEPQIRWIGG